jgi:hypothetical protein
MFQRDGRPVHVPEGDVTQRVLNGEVAFLKSDKIPVRSPRGDFGWVPGENLAKAFRAGYAFDMAGARAQIPKYSPVTGETIDWRFAPAQALHAFTQGLTFGTSALASSAVLSPEEKAERRLMQEAFPKTTMGFDILGSILGLGKLKWGAKASQAIAKKIVSKNVPTSIAKAAGRTVGGAAEGGMVGGGAALSDIALGDVENAAEHFVGGVGMGALFGGGISAGLQLPGLGARGLKAGVGALWRRATGERMRKWAAEKTSKFVSQITDADPKTVEDFFVGPASREMRRLATETEEVLEKLGTRGAQVQDEAEALSKVILPEAAALRPDKIATMLKGKPIQPAAEEVFSIINQGLQGIKALAGSLPKGKLRRPVRDLQKVVSQAFDEAEKAIQKKNLAGLFEAADTLKRTLQMPGVWTDLKVAFKTLPPEAQQALKNVQQLSKMLRSHLEDPKYYGEAAKMQQEMNALWNRYYNRLGYKGRERFRIRTEGKPGYQPEYQANKATFKSFVERAPSQAKSEADMRFLMELNDARLGLWRGVQKWYQNPELQKLVPKMTANRKSFARWISAVEESAVARRQWKNLEAAHSPLAGTLDVARKLAYFGPFGGALAATAGAPLGLSMLAPVGFLAGVKVLESLAKPTKILRTIAAIERRRVQNNARISDVAKSLWKLLDKGEESVLRKATPAITVPAVLGTMLPKAKGRPKKEDAKPTTGSLYKKQLNKLAQFQADPQKLGESLWQRPERLEEVPLPFMIASQVQMHKTVDYLVETAPKPQVGLMSEDWEPDQGDLLTWTERVQASNDPVSVLEAAYRGEVSTAQVEAVALLYPQLYDEMRQAVLEAVGMEGWAKLPYNTRLALSTFMDMPTDPSLQPDFVMAMQQLYAAEPERPQSVASLPPRDRMGRFTSKGKMHERAETLTERMSG